MYTIVYTNYGVHVDVYTREEFIAALEDGKYENCEWVHPSEFEWERNYHGFIIAGGSVAFPEDIK